MPTAEPEQDERFPGGMNYVDWLMNVLKPDELSPANIDEIVLSVRKARAHYEAGGKVKKEAGEPKRLLADLGMTRKKPTVWRRPV